MDGCLECVDVAREVPFFSGRADEIHGVVVTEFMDFWLHRQIVACICLDYLTQAHTPTLFHSARTHPETLAMQRIQVPLFPNFR